MRGRCRAVRFKKVVNVFVSSYLSRDVFVCHTVVGLVTNDSVFPSAPRHNQRVLLPRGRVAASTSTTPRKEKMMASIVVLPVVFLEQNQARGRGGATAGWS